MTLDELRGELRSILLEEERQPVDWPRVRALCRRTLARLETEAAPIYPYEVVFHFLDDAEDRQQDGAQADQQRQRLRGWLANGKA